VNTSNGLPRLTPAELDVMKALWNTGRLSAREVHERVAEARGWAYSTTRTTVERLVRKGYLAKRSFHGIHLYEPRISRVTGLARMVHEFAANVLELSQAPVVALFAESEALTDEELDELMALLESLSDRQDSP